jgi:hypothetical protein
LPHLPNQDWWATGDTSYVCIVRFDEPVTGSLASIAASQQAERAQAVAAQELADQVARQQQVAAKQITIGDCAQPPSLAKVSCSEPNSYRAYARSNVASAGGAYPATESLSQQAHERCESTYFSAGLTGYFRVVVPSQAEWEDYGVYAATCLVEVVPTSISVEDLVSEAIVDGAGF